MASIRERDGKYQVRWRVNGRMRSQSFTRMIDARRFANAVETDLERGDYIDPRAGTATLGEYADRWLALRHDRARSTLDRDRSYLASMILPAFGQRAVGAITETDVEAWIAHLDRAPATKALALRITRSILDLARRDKAIRSNPAADVKPPTVKRRAAVGRALSDDELAKLLHAAEVVDPDTACMVWLMARCGLRVGEILALRRSDVDPEGGVLTVSRSLSRREGARPLKGRTDEAESRTVPIPADAEQRMRQHLDSQAVLTIDGTVFTTSTGRPWRYDNWRTRRWVPTVEAANIGSVRPHDLRHTAATRLFLVDRWTPAEVQAFLGHADPRVTLAIYTHVTGGGLPKPSDLVLEVGRG